MPPARPSLDLLTALSDEHVLRALVDTERLTRAELADRTGLSKPTTSESVKRLLAAGLVVDTGERTTGRGRVGTYYALAESGLALVASIAPEGVVAETVNVRGTVRTRHTEGIAVPTGPGAAGDALRTAAAAVLPDGTTARLAVVSAADPVDRASGRLRHLPDAPFLVGDLSPVAVLSPVVAGAVEVDNDVHWAARAEMDADPGLRDVVLLHLGAGLGAALVADGEVRRGHGGIAGEIAHVWTVGPHGAARPFTEVFAELGLRHRGSPAVDPDRVLRAAPAVLDAVAEAVAGVVAALVAVADPQAVLLTGAWGAADAVVARVARRVAGSPRPIAVRAALVTCEPSLTGARRRAVEALRAELYASVAPLRATPPPPR